MSIRLTANNDSVRKRARLVNAISSGTPGSRALSGVLARSRPQEASFGEEWDDWSDGGDSDADDEDSD
jgi:hypothetical protein